MHLFLPTRFRVSRAKLHAQRPEQTKRTTSHPATTIGTTPLTATRDKDRFDEPVLAFLVPGSVWRTRKSGHCGSQTLTAMLMRMMQAKPLMFHFPPPNEPLRERIYKHGTGPVGRERDWVCEVNLDSQQEEVDADEAEFAANGASLEEVAKLSWR